jgi:acyl carrier protein
VADTPRPDVPRRLVEVFRAVFDRPALAVGRDTTARDVAGWDSFMHVNLIVAIEEAFGVAFSTREIGSFTCVGDVVDLLDAKGALRPGS